jgi:hypothetical protein
MVLLVQFLHPVSEFRLLVVSGFGAYQLLAQRASYRLRLEAT